MAKFKVLSETTAMQVCLDSLKGLTKEAQQRSIDWLGDVLGLKATGALSAPTTHSGGGSTVPSPTLAGDTPDPETFMTQKQPGSEIERVTCLGFYLATYRATKTFKTRDLTTLNTEAAQTKIGNATQAVDNATKSAHYLTIAGGGKKQLTARGKAVVIALPDTEAVKEALAKHPAKSTRRRRAKTTKRASA
jgi:hypothetical protein